MCILNIKHIKLFDLTIKTLYDIVEELWTSSPRIPHAELLVCRQPDTGSGVGLPCQTENSFSVANNNP